MIRIVLKSLQELHEGIGSAVAQKPRVGRLEPSQGLFLHRQIRLDIAMSRSRAFMAEPERDQVEGNSGLQQGIAVVCRRRCGETRFCFRSGSWVCARLTASSRRRATFDLVIRVPLRFGSKGPRRAGEDSDAARRAAPAPSLSTGESTAACVPCRADAHRRRHPGSRRPRAHQ
jgi:hypothetical protein